MRIGIIDNLVSKLRGIFGRTALANTFKGHTPPSAPKEACYGRRNNEQKNRPVRVLSPPPGKSVLGPAFIPPQAYHHVTRQTCRAYLRAVAFAQLTKKYPHIPRRYRRKYARLNAHLEYQIMMRDRAKQIPEQEELAAARMAPAELEPITSVT